MNKKKWSKILLSLLCAVCALFGLVFGAACTDDPIEDKEEHGAYYCDDNGVEHLLVLSKGDLVALNIGDSEKEGSYILGESGAITLTLGEDTYIATLQSDGTIVLIYNDSVYTFLRKIDYTVTFDAQNGEQPATATVTNGKLAQKPADPTREGYKFLGWYTSKEYSMETEYRFTEAVTGDITLYARWYEELEGETEYTVSFDLGYEGAEPIVAATTAGGKLYNLPMPERDDLKFVGWWVSNYEDPHKLTYQYTDQTLYSDATLYAVWGEGSLHLSVASTQITWNALGANLSYTLKVTDPNGATETINANGRTSYRYDFGSKAAGDYIVEVTSSNQKSATAYFRNKALARVCKFEVVDSKLMFNAVEHAQNYLVTVVCGDATHTHILYDNGTSTVYDFSACPMKKGGIEFTVRAEASGYAPSESEVFKFERTLAPVANLAVNEESGMLGWDSVENATSYVVRIGEEEFQTAETSYSIKEFGKSNLAVSVYAKAHGYNDSEPTAITYEKNRLATVTAVNLSGANTVTWNAVDDAKGYLVKIGANEYSVETNEFELQNEYFTDDAVVFTVTALGATEAENSYESQPFTVHAGVMGSVRYSAGEVSWDYAVGVSQYQIRINDQPEDKYITVDGTVNHAKVTLDRPGNNNIYVRCIGVDGEASEWVNVTVAARMLTFDSNTGVTSRRIAIFLAEGDPITAPEVTQIGCTFAGWFSASIDGDQFTDTVFDGTAGILLFAHWESNPYLAKFTVSEAEGTLDVTQSTVYYNQVFQLPVPASKDITKTFTGWYSEPNGGGVAFTDPKGLGLNVWNSARDIVLYPKWENIFTFYLINNETAYSVGKADAIKLVDTVTIPTEYNGKPVTTVEAGGFKSCSSLLRINIPDTIRNIELGASGSYSTGSAFELCYNLLEINIYEVDGNHVPRYASENGALYKVEYNADDVLISKEIVAYPHGREDAFTLAADTTLIPSYALANSRFTSVTIPASVKTIGASAFKSCSYLTEVIFEDATSASTLEIAELAFESCYKLESIKLPAQLSSIVLNEFKDNGDGTDSIISAFAGCSGLKTLEVSEDNQFYSSKGDGVLYSKNGSEIVFAPRGLTGKFVVPTNVTTIRDAAFYQCNKITELTIPGSVTYIGKKAFYNTSSGLTSSSLSSVTFNGTAADTDLTIESYAFYNQNALTEITLPGNLKTLKQYAFGATTKLIKVTVNCVGDLNFEKGAFENTSSNTYVKTLVLGEHVSVVDIAGVFGQKLESVSVDKNNPNYSAVEGVLFDKEIKRIVYYPQGKEGDYELPQTVEEIGAKVFYNVKELTKITINANVKLIGEEAFFGCGKIAQVVFAGNSDVALTIGKGAFKNCVGITEIALPERTVSVGIEAFMGCANLASVSIPATLKLLGATEIASGDAYSDPVSVFTNCNRLATITVAEGNTAFAAIGNVLYGKTNISEEGKDPVYEISDLYFSPAMGSGENGVVTIPNTVKKIWDKAFYNNSTITKVCFDGKAKYEVEFGEQVFYGTTALKEVELPRGMKKISTDFFYNCQALASVTIPNTVTEIEYKAFNNCPLLTDVTFELNGKDPLVINGGQEKQKQDVGGGHYETVTVYIGIFYNCGEITSLTFPQRITEIGEYAFYELPLEEIVFSENEYEKEDGSKTSCLTKIGNNAFYKTKIAELSLPANLTEIGTNAFAAYTYNFEPQLTTLTFAKGSKLATIGSSAFANQTKLTAVTIPASVKTIGISAFSGTKALTSLMFGADSLLETIGDSAFNGSVFQSVVIPASVKKIGNSAFSGNAKLASITFETGSHLEEIGNSAFASTGIESFSFPVSEATSIKLGTTLFQGCKQLTTLHLSKSVTAGVDVAFNKAPALKKVTVAEDNENYAADANLPIIYNAAGQSVLFIYGDLGASGALQAGGVFVIPEGATEIGAFAFQKQVDIKEIRIPATVRSIGEGAFLNCAGLQKVTFAEGSELTLLGKSAFARCTSLTSIELPSSLKKVYQRTFAGCTSLSSVTLTGITHILESPNIKEDSYSYPGSSYLFEDCTSLTSVTFPSTLEVMGKYVFDGCANLQSVTFKEGMKMIGGSLLDECPLVTSITIPKSVEKIDSSAFYESGLTSVEIPEDSNLKEIGSSAFAKTAITSIRIPDSVTLIGASAFNECTQLAKVIISNKNNVTELKGSVFKKCAALSGTVEFPNLKTIGSNDFQESGFEIVKLPALEKMSSSAFQECPNLLTVTFGSDKLDQLGSKTFYKCPVLDEIDLTKTGLLHLGANSFELSGIRTVKLPDTLLYITYSKKTSFPSGTSNASTFKDCTRLSSVTFGSNLQIIGQRTFYGCTALKSIEIPSTLKRVEDYAFQNSGLTSIDFSDVSDAIVFKPYVFAGCVDLVDVQFNNATTTFGNYMFQNCTSLESITLPDNLTTTGTYTFDGCSSLTKVTFGSKLKTIGNYAFRGCSSLKEITLPNVLTTIGSSAFENAGLTSVTIPATVTTINAGAFFGCDFTTVNIPAKVTSIGNEAFGNCRLLASITVDSANTRFSADGGVLYSKDGKTLVYYPAGLTEEVWKEGVTTIGTYAFEGSRLTSLTIPETVTTINTGAFRISDITDITVPASYVEIGANAFKSANKLQKITFNGKITEIGNYAFDGASALQQVVFKDSSALTKIGTYAFRNTGLTSFTLPDAVMSIGNNAFDGTEKLTEFIIGDKSALETIGQYAFQNSGIESFTVPDAVEKLDSYTFQYARNLTEINFGEKSQLTSLGTYTFRESGLTSIKFPASITKLGSTTFKDSVNLKTVDFSATSLTSIASVFSGCTSIDTVIFPTCEFTIASSAFKGCAFTNLVLPDNLTSIGSSAFENNTNLVSVTFPKGEFTIGGSAFKGCGFESIEIPANATSIGNNAFQNNVNLVSVKIAEGVTALGNYVFSGCALLTEVQLPNTLTHLGTYTFQNCTALESIELPDSVVYIGTAADTMPAATASVYLFAGCEKLTSVKLPANLIALGGYAFQNCTSLASLELPESLQLVGKNAFENTALTTLDLSGLTEMGTAVFKGCTALETVKLPAIDMIPSETFIESSIKSVVVPEGVTQIGYRCFMDCTELTSVTLPSTLTNIGYRAFSGCTKVKSIYIHEDVYLGHTVFEFWTADQTVYIAESQYVTLGYWSVPSVTSETAWNLSCEAKVVYNYTPTTTPTEE